MHTTRLYSTGIVIIFCALISACSRQTESVGPRFSGRLLLLAGDNTNGADLLELSAAPTGSTYNYSVVTRGVFEAAASPDQTRLLYTTKDGIQLRDLRTGAVKELAKGETYCLAWSPDGTLFSYKQKSPASERAAVSAARASTKLYVSDLDGKARLIFEDLFADYSNVSMEGQASAVEERPADSSGCPQWIASDRLIFDRFLGALPKQRKMGEVLKPNTTTLAILSDPVKLSNTNRKWSLEGVCQVGSAAILRPHDQAQPILLARSLDHLETLDPAPASCSGCRFVGFAARSCVPFFIEAGSTSSELFYLNPTNWQRQRGAHIDRTFSVEAKMLVKSSARLMIVGDVPASLLLIDTESGETVPFFPKPGQPAVSDGVLVSPRPIAWIENQVSVP